MLRLRRVAVTGGLGAGKSTLCHLLQEQGAFVISADAIVHQHLSPQTKIGKEIIHLLGQGIVIGGQCDRKAIADLVFADTRLLLEFEKILHPAVWEEIEASYQKVRTDTKYSLFIAEIPLLYEAGFEKNFDKILVVTAQEAICKDRFAKGDKEKEAEFTRRTKRLIEIEEKCKHADFVITNEGTLTELKKNITYVYNILTSP